MKYKNELDCGIYTIISYFVGLILGSVFIIVLHLVFDIIMNPWYILFGGFTVGVFLAITVYIINTSRNIMTDNTVIVKRFKRKKSNESKREMTNNIDNWEKEMKIKHPKFKVIDRELIDDPKNNDAIYTIKYII